MSSFTHRQGGRPCESAERLVSTAIGLAPPRHLRHPSFSKSLTGLRLGRQRPLLPGNYHWIHKHNCSARSISNSLIQPILFALQTSGIFGRFGPPLGFSSVTTKQENTIAVAIRKGSAPDLRLFKSQYSTFAAVTRPPNGS